MVIHDMTLAIYHLSSIQYLLPKGMTEHGSTSRVKIGYLCMREQPTCASTNKTTFLQLEREEYDGSDE